MVIIHYISKQPTIVERINLMLIERHQNKHFTWIKNFNGLLYDQSNHKEKKYFCETCLHGYSKESLLNAHKPDCQGIIKRAVKIEMPEPNTKLKFQNHHKQLPAPFVVYADFESLIKKSVYSS